jgi:hypothetical protein
MTRPDAVILAIDQGTTGSTGLVFGLVPALVVSRVSSSSWRVGASAGRVLSAGGGSPERVCPPWP